MTADFLFKIHYSLTLYMSGIIWLVQIIHYPLFKLVGESNFKSYHKDHVRRTSVVIAFPMTLELITCLYLLFAYEAYRSNPLFLASCAILVFIWYVTFFISVPRHNKLTQGFNDTTIDALVKTNWLRTLAWSSRAVLLFQLLH